MALQTRYLPAAHGRERLDRDPHHVVLRLLRRERRAARLGVEAEGERLRVLDSEPLRHQRRPAISVSLPSLRLRQKRAARGLNHSEAQD